MAENSPSLARWFHGATGYPPSCGQGVREPRETCGTVLSLPRPRALTRALAEAIAGRASCRRFAPATLALADVSTLLHSAYGTYGEAAVAGFRFETRPVPSAGATYPLDVHLVAWRVSGTASGIYRYLPAPHALERMEGHVSPESACEFFLGQSHIASAAALVVVTARFEVPLARYGDRGYRYVLLEAGHLVQNLNLACSALGLANLNLGGFQDGQLSEGLGLSGEAPLYGVALGHPTGPDGDHTREPAQGSADRWAPRGHG
jgi:SagB-type dehydrogenase family enzyme